MNGTLVHTERWLESRHHRLTTRMIPALIVLLAMVAGLQAVAAVPLHEREPQRLALLVGVSEYPYLPKTRTYQLRGPRNDIRLVADVLQRREFSPGNIVVLADGIDGATLPTRAAILGAFERLISQAGPGDFVYVHFAGHGSMQYVVADDPTLITEANLMDEVFLPRDVRLWTPGDGIQNALIDDEVGAFVAALVDRGAFVWIVFDSCHSGDMLRSAPDDEEERSRSIPFAAMVPPENLAALSANLGRIAAKAGNTRGRNSPGPRFEKSIDDVSSAGGQWVALYAAHTDQTTPERPLPILPKDDPARNQFGLFTFTLMQVIERNHAISYRQAVQEVARTYTAMNRYRPVPLIEGTALDAVIFDTRNASVEEQYRLVSGNDVLEIEAGRLHGVGTGSILSVVPSPTAVNAEAIGVVEVIEAGLIRSVVVPKGRGESQPLAVVEIPIGAYARPLDRSISLSLRVARPAEVDGSAGRGEQGLMSDVAKISGGLIEWVEPGEPADVRLAVREQSIWLLGPEGVLCARGDVERGDRPECSTSADITLALPIDDETPKRLAESLKRIAKATNLIRVAEVAHRPAQLELAVSIMLSSDGVTWRDITTEARPQLSHGDRLRIGAGNRSSQPVDLSILYVDPFWGIVPVHPRPGALNRLNAGDQYNSEVLKVDATKSAGLERLVLISVPAAGKVDPENFNFLAQDSLATVRGTRGSVTELFEMAGFFGGNTRSASGGENLSMLVFAFETLPVDPVEAMPNPAR